MGTPGPHQTEATMSLPEVVFAQTRWGWCQSRESPAGPLALSLPPGVLLQPAGTGWGSQAELIIFDISC